jgi:hypothetical protein
MAGAAAATLAVGQLLPFLFVLPVGLLGYAHFRAGFGTRAIGRPASCSWANSVLVALLWYGRVKMRLVC